jgi:hypothetical protein
MLSTLRAVFRVALHVLACTCAPFSSSLSAGGHLADLSNGAIDSSPTVDP